MRKLTRNFLVLSRLTSYFSRVFITNRKAEYFLDNFLSPPVWAVLFCWACPGHSLCLSLLWCLSLCGIVRNNYSDHHPGQHHLLPEMVEIMQSARRESSPPTPPHQAGWVLPSPISRNNIVGVHSCQLRQAPAGTDVTFRGYITHL